MRDDVLYIYFITFDLCLYPVLKDCVHNLEENNFEANENTDDHEELHQVCQDSLLDGWKAIIVVVDHDA